MRTCVLILGMHRSGTSMLAGVLSALGVQTGVRYGVDQIKLQNPTHGEFENDGIYRVHHQALIEAGAEWDQPEIFLAKTDWREPSVISRYADSLKEALRQFDGAQLFGYKDPRTALFIPLHLKVLCEMGIAVKIAAAKRSSHAVAASLARRNGVPEARGVELCRIYRGMIDQFSAGFPKIEISFDDMIEQTDKTIRDLESFLDVKANERTLDKIKKYVSPAFRHHS